MASSTERATAEGYGSRALSLAPASSSSLATQVATAMAAFNSRGISAAMAAEFKAFTDTRPKVESVPKPGGVHGLVCPVFPHPTEVDGLPKGWVIRWSRPHVEPSSLSGKKAGVEMFVVERLAGGWDVLMHAPYGGIKETVMRSKTWNYVSPTIMELHAAAVWSSRIGFPEPEQVIRAFVLSCYDLTDPVEEAEATLVGLGGPLTVFPAALR